MGGLSTGGGSSAVAASAHAACERFRRTDPLITRKSRRALADHLGSPDTEAGIPEARWMRAMTFESLVQSERFVSELLTKAVGQLGLPRPVGVRRRSGRVSTDTTAKELAQGHLKAVHEGAATMLTALAIPFMDLESNAGATPTKPDFAIVVPRTDERGTVVGSWLIMGDAKDYERVRSRIDDARMLKGFLQVALGAESAMCWSKLPDGMVVHPYGALAVPRNAFLQPEAVVERLDDHRREVRTRAEERLKVMADLGDERPAEAELVDYVQQIQAEFDPGTCPTCNLFAYCRDELRQSSDPEAVLTEIGIDPFERPTVRGLVDGTGVIGQASSATLAQVRGTIEGLPQWTGRRRTDPVGTPGCVNVVLVKSDAAALGVHGLAVGRVGKHGPAPWKTKMFLEPQGMPTRHAVMRLIGKALRDCMDEGVLPLHLVVPDRPTADLLVSMADSLAGVELSRLRWQRDQEMGRPVLTFDGAPASVPAGLDSDARLAVSFLLEEDRARAMTLRCPIVNLQRILNLHVIAGGPARDSGRLDYLLAWASATEPVDHRAVSDSIADSADTPGARLSNALSDKVHLAHRGKRADPKRYKKLVEAALGYRTRTFDAAVRVLAKLPDSALRPVYRVLEDDAQVVWRRRLNLQASDLVRFSRTYDRWRNDQVEMLDADVKCASQLTVLVDGQAAHDAAMDAGTRELALATVLSTNPIRLSVASRHLTAGSHAVLLHVNDRPQVEEPATLLKIQKGSFKFRQIALGPLEDAGRGAALTWRPAVIPAVTVGDELVLADALWFGRLLSSGHEFTVDRPKLDTNTAPKVTCTPSSYADDPDGHRWCCRPHSAVEAEWSDTLAGRRARNELNPETWPPVIDEDRFDVGVDRAPTVDLSKPPADLTPDDIE